MIHKNGDGELAVDVVIPIYGERGEALSATLSACLKLTHPISKIFVVDDGSPEPISLPRWAQASAQISLLRLPRNQGISAARNAAIALSNATFLACINKEVLPAPASAPVIRVSCPKDRIACLRDGACGFKNRSTRNNPAPRFSPMGMLSYFARKRSTQSADMTSAIAAITRIRTSVKE